jgi:uncharacterized protein YecT (DUF1311 family)
MTLPTRRMLMICLALLWMASLSGPALAQKDCTDRPECWPEGSAMHTGLTLAAERRKLEAAMGKRHDELLQMVRTAIPWSDRLAMALERQQQAWLKYRDDECELIGALTGAGGSWPSTYASRCSLNLTDQRLRRIRSAYRCVDRVRKQGQEYDASRCLQQLAPLVNR